MSKNNKNARLNHEAKQRSATRQGGSKCGPSGGVRATASTHGKKKAWWQLYKSYGEYIRGGGKRPQRGGKLEVEQDAAA